MSIHQQMLGGQQTSALVISPRMMYTTAAVIVTGIAAPILAPGVVETIQSNWLALFLVAVFGSFAVTLAQTHIQNEQTKSREFPQMFVPMPFSEEDLKWYDGERNSSKMRMVRGTFGAAHADQHPLPQYDDLIFLAVKGVVYNVSRDFYGPGAGYSVFAGKDSSRHLGKVVVGETESNCDWTTMTDKHIGILNDWEEKYRGKYCIAGWVEPVGKEYFSRAEEFEP